MSQSKQRWAKELFTQSEFHLDMLKKIQDKGFVTIGIQPEEDNFPFVYTVGLADKGMPDLIVVGNMSQSLMSTIIIKVAKLFEENGPTVGIIEGLIKVPLKIVSVDPEIVADKMLVTDAYNAYKAHDNYFVQILWPDEEGRFPDNVNFSKKFADATEILPLRKAH
ncbi:DUF4262 domain-containing protein [Shewanella aestuarii]|uniref:DUF4262 domain-containing protein n=1 Tax=Shewanella aestuarii TaxID=1028752 RepID=A0A6G9QS89_9GAMM|nr:DUF4262 domain-containing protein [Shewanella aestuarii]QIR16641.1 DUF4262 domain-containing protein [Shewanella aestuarii]